jgi:hypothetical protein
MPPSAAGLGVGIGARCARCSRPGCHRRQRQPAEAAALGPFPAGSGKTTTPPIARAVAITASGPCCCRRVSPVSSAKRNTRHHASAVSMRGVRTSARAGALLAVSGVLAGPRPGPAGRLLNIRILSPPTSVVRLRTSPDARLRGSGIGWASQRERHAVAKPAAALRPPGRVRNRRGHAGNTGRGVGHGIASSIDDRNRRKQ